VAIATHPAPVGHTSTSPIGTRQWRSETAAGVDGGSVVAGGLRDRQRGGGFGLFCTINSGLPSDLITGADFP
jgi:hypothetical protein